MAYTFTVGGYTFENPPENHRKRIRLGNAPQRAYDRQAPSYYQSDSQDLQLEVEGSLAIDPALGGTDDLAELERLQQIGIDGGEVRVDFSPFYSGLAVIEDDPLRQSDGESSYVFIFDLNTEDTDASAYPAHSAPDTGNTFEYGDLDLGYDPTSVSQNYDRNVETVHRLQGISRSKDTAGLVPNVSVSGRIDGGGQAQLWAKAKANAVAYLTAEFQNGWALISDLSVESMQQAPHYLQGMFQYEMSLYIVSDPASGIGETSLYVDREVL